MAAGNRLTFHPQRILWIGILQLGAFALFGLPFLLCFPEKNPVWVSAERKEAAPLCLSSFSFGMQPQEFSVQIPDLENEILFSFDPLRPHLKQEEEKELQLRVHLPRSEASRRVTLPARIDLQFVSGVLSFSSKVSSFWLELAWTPAGRIEARIFAGEEGNRAVAVGRFSALPQESPLRSAQEFSEGSPFRRLAEARSLGQDLVKEIYLGGLLLERLEIGSPPYVLALKAGDWMVWDEGHWKRSELAEARAHQPIARIASVGPRNLMIEGWDSEGHIRLAVPLATGSPFKGRAEELFSAVRIRSEKQISCMLEKQCLVLKPGDWVLKVDNRWKILRKKQERESFLSREMAGELFVFEQILLKQGQKVIQGRFFNTGRSQAMPVEIQAQSARRRPEGEFPSQKEDKKRGPAR